MHPNIPHHLDRRPGDYPRRAIPKYGWRDDNGKPIHEIDEEGNPICGRICSTTGIPCTHSGKFLTENGRCANVGHGGRAPGAPIKHGRYSIFLPTRLAANYEEITRDDVINDVHESLAVVVAMMQEKMVQLTENSSAQLWAQSGRLIQELKEAITASWFQVPPPRPLPVSSSGLMPQASGPPPSTPNTDPTPFSPFQPNRIAHLLDRLEALHASGSGARQREKELLDLMTKAAALTKVEIHRLEKMGQFMTAREMMANTALVLDILKRHVDLPTLAKVAAELGPAAHARYS